MTKEELVRCGVEPLHILPGGVEFEGDFALLMKAALHIRTASRLLIRLAHFPAYNLKQLALHAMQQVTWDRFLCVQDRIFIKTTCHASTIYHTQAASERIQKAACTAVSCTPAKSPNDATATIFVRIDHNLCTISMDATGPLHQRGYRQETGKAPLRETWAAAVLLLANWDGSRPLLDPMCGSGTFPIEAACMAAGIPPGRMRTFPFFKWPIFDLTVWEKLVANADVHVRPVSVPILGADRDPCVIHAAFRNAQRAGVASWVSFECRPISATPPINESGLLVCNPPWGLRIGERRLLRDLYAALGHVARKNLPQFDVALLTPHMYLARETKLPFEKPAMMFPSGGTRVFVFLKK